MVKEMTSSGWAKAVTIGGAILAAAGGVAWAVSRRSSLGRPVPQLVGRRKRGGRTLSHYRDRRMTIDQRIKLLQRLVWKGVQDPANRKLALNITRSCPERDGLCEAKAIYNAMKKRIRYTGDVGPVAMPDGSVEGIDLFQGASATWDYGGGDCDDHNVFGATMLALNGLTAKFRTTSAGRFEDYSHIYVIAGLPKNDPDRWIALDTTLPGSDNFGKEAPYGRVRDWDV